MSRLRRLRNAVPSAGGYLAGAWSGTTSCRRAKADARLSPCIRSATARSTRRSLTWSSRGCIPRSRRCGSTRISGASSAGSMTSRPTSTRRLGGNLADRASGEQRLRLIERILEARHQRLIRRGSGHIEPRALEDLDRIVRASGLEYRQVVVALARAALQDRLGE